jgi:imidazolonepropionase-like amidohydrolase
VRRICEIGFALICALPLAASGAEEIIVVHAGTLLTVPGVAPKQRQTLVISNGRITAIMDGFRTPAQVAAGVAASRLDLSNAFVLPGLIDLHVHLTTDVEAGEALRTVTRTAADLALVARRHALETLKVGFTTVLDMGTATLAHEEAIYALRDGIRAGVVTGPRILTVGTPLSTTGSSRTERFTAEVAAAVGPQGVCDGPESCTRAVREQIRRGADAIAFYCSGSLRDPELIEQTMTDDEMRAVVATAHALGRKVIADGHTAAGINAALRAGVDVLDTVPWPDGMTWELSKKRDIFFEPHMHAFKVAAALAMPPTAPDDNSVESPAAIRVRDVLSNPFSAQIAHQHGVKLAYGSDTGIVRHGDNAGDFAELVAIGLTTMQAIEVATVNSARAIGWDNEIGTLEVGKRADLIAIDENPLTDIGALRKVRYVMRDGHGLETR